MSPRQLQPLFLLAVLLFGALCAQAQDAVRPTLMELPISARLAGSAESMGAPLRAALGDVLSQPALLDSTHEGQLHLGYMDYFSGTAQAAALYARRPKARKWMWHTGLRNFGFGNFTARDPTGIETGQFSASDVAWVSGAAIPLDTNLTLGASLWLGQSTLADRRSNFSQLDLGLTYFRLDRQLRLAALWRPWGGMTNVNGGGTSGRFDSDLELSISKGFDNAPFILMATYDQMDTWDISPEGLYEDTIDPLTGDTLSSGTWAFGDRLLRHLALGAELDLGNGLHFRFGYHHRRRQELRLNSAPGTAGFAWGLDFSVRRFQLSIARNTYHTAGASTHFAIRTRLTDDDLQPMKRIRIAIDGLSASGKSTLAQGLAKSLNYLYIDSGAMYRAVTLFALRERLLGHSGELDEEGLVHALDRVFLTFRFNPASGRGEICLNGRNVEKEIRTHEVSRHVSVVSKVSPVRNKLVRAQQRMADGGGVVMDGRDIGTVVLPDSEVKFFMTASIDARSVRRFNELQKRGREVSLDQVKENLIERDRIDSTRDHSPLQKAEDAIVIDNSDLSIEQQFEHMLTLIQETLHG